MCGVIALQKKLASSSSFSFFAFGFGEDLEEVC